MSIILNTDSYKISHYLQYPPKTQYVSSYIESRGGDYDFQLFFGLQMALRELKAPTLDEVMEAEEILRAHGYVPNTQGWSEIARLGYLPVHIEAVKEGTVLPNKNALVQLVNTDPRFPWLTSYLETMLLRAVWYPTTVATRSKFIKNMIAKALEETCDDPAANLPFKLHDFGYRGVSSKESGSIGGIAHLVNFMGTDTIGALLYGRKFYGETMAGFSIPAAEHSTITSWGRDGEVTAYANMLSAFGAGIVAVVSDSYDIYNAAANIWGGVLKERVETMGGTLVVRPDSGDPTIVPIEVIKILGEKFGTTTNSKGYRVLPNCIRVIQGDGVNEHSIQIILDRLKEAGFSAENITFGMGGEMLQTMNRDSLRFAMKASAIKVDGDFWRDVSKDPVTDPGKKSKAGRLALIKESSGYQTIRVEELGARTNLLEPVFHNGTILRNQTLSDIRALSNA